MTLILRQDVGLEGNFVRARAFALRTPTRIPYYTYPLKLYYMSLKILGSIE